VADKERIGAWVTVALTLGLRPGEISGLTWPAIDLAASKVVIHQSFAWVSDQPMMKAPKTGRSRTLDLPPRTVEALRRHRTAQIEERLLMGDRWPLRWEDLVFVTTNGTPIGPTNLRRVISRMAFEAGIDGGLTPYDLRHTATSLFSASGVAPEVLADLLGHRNTRMVFRHYRHPVTPTISVAADHIEGALAL
jgi:integrase